MTEIEYQEFVRRCPYDAMGDYSMFRKEQTDTCVTKESRTPVQKKRVSS